MSSGYSSNPFPRSLGQHTPSTSIDASLPPSIKIGHEREQSNHYTAPEDDFSADTLVPSRRELEQDLSHPINAGVEAEYYISDASEDSVDSFVAWKEKRRGEEGLLYREDYGIAGAGLPGLFEPLPIPKAPPPAEPPAPIKPPKTPKSPRRPTTRGSKSTPKKSRSQHSRRSRTSTFSPPRHHHREPRNGSSSDDEDSDSLFWERARDMPHGPSFVSLADLGIDLRHLGLDQYGLTEEDDAKVDMRTAVKLRKEMRRRKLESARRSRVYGDEGCVADAED